MLLALLGICLSVPEMHREDVRRIAPRLGLFLNIAALILWLIVLAAGVV